MTVRAMNKTDRRRLWALWGGAGLYFLILLNGLRYVGELPLVAIVGLYLQPSLSPSGESTRNRKAKPNWKTSSSGQASCLMLTGKGPVPFGWEQSCIASRC